MEQDQVSIQHHTTFDDTTPPTRAGRSVPLVFNYLNYREYLTDYYRHKKAAQKSFSYAVFSLRAGIKSPNYLKLVMDGSRNLTSENIPKFSKALGHSSEEASYFEVMVEFTQARTAERKQHFFSKLAAHPKANLNGEVREIRDEWELLSSWHHLAVRELVLLPGFSEDPEHLSLVLGRRISPGQARASLELLERMGFLVRDKTGRLRQAERTVRYFSKQDIRQLAVQRFHQSTGELALKLLAELPPSARDFSGLTLAVNEADLPRIKARITEFRKELNREFSQLDSGTRVVQLNVQLFPLTK